MPSKRAVMIGEIKRAVRCSTDCATQKQSLKLITQLFVHNGYHTKFVKGVIRSCLCDVTLSVYPHRAGLKNMPGHGGIRTYDLWNTSPMLCQLSYAVRSVRADRCGYTLRVTSHKHLIHLSTLHQHSKFH